MHMHVKGRALRSSSDQGFCRRLKATGSKRRICARATGVGGLYVVDRMVAGASRTRIVGRSRSHVTRKVW